MKLHSRHHVPGPATQRGAALLVALILLVVITLVGLAAIGATILQNKAASNQYDRQIAFQAAEAALRRAEFEIAAATSNAGVPVAQAILDDAGFRDCSAAYNADPLPCQANAFANAGTHITSVPASAFSAGPLAAMPPQYLVQYMGMFVAPEANVRQTGGPTPYGASRNQDECANYYRITARSADPSQVTGRAVVTLQSTFRNGGRTCS